MIGTSASAPCISRGQEDEAQEDEAVELLQLTGSHDGEQAFHGPLAVGTALREADLSPLDRCAELRVGH